MRFKSFILDNRLFVGAYDAAAIESAASLMATAAGAYSAGESNDTTKEMYYHNMEWQEKMYDRKLKDQRALIDEQNKYNSPANQRKLYEDAGFNPNLVMSGMAGVSASKGSTDTPNTSSNSVPSLHAYDPAAAMSAAANIANVASNAELNKAKADNLKSDTQNKDIKNSFDEIQLGFWQKYGDLKWKLDLNKTDAESSLNDALRRATSIDERLKTFDLFNIKPAIYQRTLAETLTEYSKKDANDALSFKSYAEGKKHLTESALATGVALATIRMYNSVSNWNNTQASVLDTNWKPSSGVLWRDANWRATDSKWRASNAYLDNIKQTKLYKSLFDGYIDSLKMQLSAKNRYLSKYVDGSNRSLSWKFEHDGFIGAADWISNQIIGGISQNFGGFMGMDLGTSMTNPSFDNPF